MVIERLRIQGRFGLMVATAGFLLLAFLPPAGFDISLLVLSILAVVTAMWPKKGDYESTPLLTDHPFTFISEHL